MQVGTCFLDPAIAEEVMNAVSSLGEEVSISSFDTGRAICEAVSSGLDAVFLILNLEDIFLDQGGLTSMEAGIYLRRNCGWKGPIIFISEKFDYSPEIFDLQPLNYFPLPLDVPRLQKYMEGIINQQLQKETALICKAKNGRAAIPAKTIRFISSYQRKVLIHATTGKYETYMKLETAAQQLGEDFIQTHQSYLVNRAYVVKVMADNLVLDNEQTIPISRKYQRDVLGKYCTKTRISLEPEAMNNGKDS